MKRSETTSKALRLRSESTSRMSFGKESFILNSASAGKSLLKDAPMLKRWSFGTFLMVRKRQAPFGGSVFTIKYWLAMS